MKHIAAVALATAVFGATTAQAGNTVTPVLEPIIVVEDAKAGSSSSAMTIVALTGLFMFAVVASR